MAIPEQVRPGGPGPLDPAPAHLVVTVHGIRTYGGWQANLKGLLEEAEPGIQVENYKYNYFSSVAFLVPLLRWIEARRFRKFLVHEIRQLPAGARVDLVAHSFGTYLAASALAALPEGRAIHTVLFAGSVLRPSFPWYRYLAEGKVRRVVNECGWDDSVLVLCQFAALSLGMAGRVGFRGMIGERFQNRFYRGGHGLYFDQAGRLLRERWLPILTADRPVAEVDERPELTAWGGTKLFLLDNMSFIKVAGALAMMMALVWVPIDWSRKNDFQKRIHRFDHIARLTNAVQIPGRDPEHVRELLRLDVQARHGGDSYERSIDQMIGTEDLRDSKEGDLQGPDERPPWWEMIPGLRDDSRDAYEARRLHAEANLELAGKRGPVRDLSKARVRFEDAIREYEKVNVKDPSFGCYALCLLDHGRLLNDMGLPELAIKQFDKVRTAAFPPGKDGTYPDKPLSVEVDALCGKAKALQQLEKWPDAAVALLEAARRAEEAKDDALSSYVLNELGWLKMDQLDVAEAVKSFKDARDACEKLVDNGRLIFRTRLYHVRHGLAMAERLQGKVADSYDHFTRIVEELKVLLKDDLRYGPKDRRDLRDRLVNSMERRADVHFFARSLPTRPARGSSRAAVDRRRDELRKMEADFRDALREVTDDDPTTRLQLLYKKVITRFLAEIAARPTGDDPSALAASRDPAEGPDAPRADFPTDLPIDIEFAEAEQVFRSLSPERREDARTHRDVAACCMKLRQRAPSRESDSAGVDAAADASRSREFDPRAVAELRALTRDSYQKCNKFKRENVEMLLVALEILLEPGVEDNHSITVRDAARMMATLEKTAEVDDHQELLPYVRRFQQIVNLRLGTPGGLEDPGRIAGPDLTPRRAEGGSTEPIGPSVVFFLRLSPTRSITITDGAPPPALRTARTR